jgi:hypothetical protein
LSKFIKSKKFQSTIFNNLPLLAAELLLKAAKLLLLIITAIMLLLLVITGIETTLAFALTETFAAVTGLTLDGSSTGAGDIAGTILSGAGILLEIKLDFFSISQRLVAIGLDDGEEVQFDLEQDPRTGKDRACNVTGPGGAPVQGQPRDSGKGFGKGKGKGGFNSGYDQQQQHYGGYDQQQQFGGFQQQFGGQQW